MIAWKGMNVLLPTVTSMMALSISSSAVSNLLEQKACSPWVQPPVNEFICNDSKILAELSDIAATKNVLKSFCSAISTAAFGYWRDATGLSLPLLLIGCVAEILATTAYFLAAVDWRSSPWIAAIMEAVISGLFGEGIYMLGANCILIAKSDEEQRTMRIQVFMTTLLLASLVTSSTSGFFLAAVGYKWVFATGILLHFLTFLLTLVFVDEVRSERDQPVRSALDQMRGLFKWRPNIVVIWLMLLSGSIVSSSFSAENSLAFYYLQQRFRFTVKEGTLYGSYHFAVALFGSFVTAVLFTKVLKWSDLRFGILASFVTTLSSLSTAIANSTIFLILSAPLAIMRLNLFPIPQSILTKCIRNDELGIFLGLGSIMGIFVMIFLNFLYKYVFSLTSKTMPGAFYFVSAGCYIFIMILLSISSCLYKPSVDCDSGSPESCAVSCDAIEDEQNFISAENA